MLVPADRIHMIEDHNQAYYIWRKLGITGKILVHIDAHIDFAWFSDADPLSLLSSNSIQELKERVKKVKAWNPSFNPRDHKPDIGNYIYPAIREGIVKTFYWVVPDSFLDTAWKIKYWKKRLARAIKDVPGHEVLITVRGGCIVSKLFDCEVVVCCLKSLPVITEKVILDIDTDFFVTDFEREKSPYFLQAKKQLPWMWPQELADILKEKNIQPEIITIAYSVEKYYTPLEFKFLGDDLKGFLCEEPISADRKMALEQRKDALIGKYSGNTDKAITCLNTAVKLNPEEASSYYNLAFLQYDRGFTQDAASSYQKAISLDATYGTRYNNLGDMYIRIGLNNKAEKEYLKILTLDPENPYAHSGIGELYSIKGNFEPAKQAFEHALALNGNINTARQILAKIFIQENKHEQAIFLLKEAIAHDPGSLQAYLLLAGIYMKQGDVDAAIGNYKCVLRLGFCETAIFARMVLLFFKKKDMPKALSSFVEVLRIFPLEIIVKIRSNIEKARLLKLILS